LRSGKEATYKRLDTFLVVEMILEEEGRMKIWVGEGGVSNNLPILLKLEKEDPKPQGPLKFNYKWMGE
jgi:hypothetical protein